MITVASPPPRAAQVTCRRSFAPREGELTLTRALIERFFSTVRQPNARGCREWAGSTRGNGYGRFCVGEKLQVSAHRIAWIIANGPIPEGLFVCHHCDNPRCVEVAHLFLGAAIDNVADMISKGRMRHPHNEERKRWTHCVHGHEFTPGNTYIGRGGKRSCKTCGRRWVSEYKTRKRSTPTDFYCPAAPRSRHVAVDRDRSGLRAACGHCGRRIGRAHAASWRWYAVDPAKDGIQR